METESIDLRSFTPNQLAEQTGIGANRIRAEIRSGNLPAFRIGRWTRVRVEDFLAWLESRRVRASVDTAAECFDAKTCRTGEGRS